MSTTNSFAVARCQIKGLNTTESAAFAVYDYLVNHPDEIPDVLADCDSDDCINQLKSYLWISDDHPPAAEVYDLIISYSTEQDNSDSSVFDCLVKHFSILQSSLFMEVTWVVEDSRTGFSAGTNYYDRSGTQIDVRTALTAYLE